MVSVGPGAGVAWSETKPSPDSFARNIMAAIGPDGGNDGGIDPTHFDCTELLESKGSARLSCRDRAAGIGFLFIPGAASEDRVDAISVAMVYKPGLDRMVTDAGELNVSDLAGYTAIEAEFAALGTAGYLTGLPPFPIETPSDPDFGDESARAIFGRVHSDALGWDRAGIA